MFHLKLSHRLEKRLAAIAEDAGLTKSRCAHQAIEQFLEDREDYIRGIVALERRDPTITLQDLERRLGL